MATDKKQTTQSTTERDAQQEFHDALRAAHAMRTPLVAVETVNQPDLIARASLLFGDVPLARWDAVRGLASLNEAGKQAIMLLGDLDPSRDPGTALQMAADLPERSVVFFVNMHRWINDPLISTGLGVLRDPYKSTKRMACILGTRFTLPIELQQDVITLIDPLPNDAALRVLSQQVLDSAQIKADDPTIERMVGAGRGCGAFTFEQQAFMSLRKSDGAYTLDETALWQRKVDAVNAVPGLRMTYGKTEKSGDVQGLNSTREYFDLLFAGPNSPRVVLFIDEIDKSLGGAGFGKSGGGDTSGVAQDQVGVMLKTMQDKKWNGMIAVGAPGTGKTMISETIAALHGVPCIALDMGALKGSLVGESEQKIRMALDTVERIGLGQVFVMATCNRLDSMPPELRRRFRAGIRYFDLPSSEERKAIWLLYTKRFALAMPKKLDDSGWTGAEIFNCCQSAWELGITVDAASVNVIPLAQSQAAEIETMRAQADGRFLSASTPGAYRRSRNSESVVSAAGRRALP